MRIKRNEKIGDVPIIKIRNYFKYLRKVGVSKEGVRAHFGLSRKEVDFLINELLQNDFIEKTDNEKQENEFQLTIKGQALCVARCVSPMNKEKADKVFNDFMKRVNDINNDDYYLYKVEKLYLFGSYLNPNNIDFGDIDIAFDLKKKIENDEKFEQADSDRVKEARRKGKVFHNFLDELFYSETEVLLKLKNRCKYISLHRLEDEILEIAEHRQIFPVLKKNISKNK